MSSTSQTTEALKSRMFDLLGSKKKSKRKSHSKNSSSEANAPSEAVDKVEKTEKKRHKRKRDAESTEQDNDDATVNKESSTEDKVSSESPAKSSKKSKKKKQKKKRKSSSAPTAASAAGGEAGVMTHDTTQQAVPAHNPFQQAQEPSSMPSEGKSEEEEETARPASFSLALADGNPEAQKELVEQWEKLLSHQRGAFAYLEDWLNQGTVKDGQQITWKFNKLRQAWLLNHLYDTTLVPDEMFDTVLEYLGKLAGQARKRTLAEAREILACTKLTPQVSKPPVVDSTHTEVPEPSAPPAEVLDDQKRQEVQMFRAEKLAELLS
eukprot:gb/GECG01008278.1/.p1 GENE.gb/GECG01008278.1/~~gb/GECG01008278.1/.p1  ORF type:complete len:322 (+),score=69.71 gb/GECG01008278.1/:1-966(+)